DAARVRAGVPVTLGVRPEHLQMARPGGEGGGIAATVALVEYLGDVTLVYFHVDGVAEMVAVKCDADTAPPSPGSKAELVFPATRAFLFDEEGRVFAPGWVESTAEPPAARASAARMP
ncbi:TOBE domain-containing protein, partial [Massilia sp.]